MSNEFRNFFYTPHDQFLFWVAGYTADGNTSNVQQMVDSLLENARKFANLVGCNLSDVQTHYNNKPPRYQYMRVFYIKTENPHPDALVLDDYQHAGKTYHRTMNDVLTT